jgi:hypothetical protein
MPSFSEVLKYLYYKFGYTGIGSGKPQEDEARNICAVYIIILF